MTVSELGTLLNNIVVDSTTTPVTKMLYRHFAWSSAPAGDYGVYAEDDSVHLDADNINAEQLIEGTIDYFTRNDSSTIPNLVMTALRNGGVYAYLNSVQYENDTGYIHYEWVFRING